MCSDIDVICGVCGQELIVGWDDYDSWTGICCHCERSTFDVGGEG
jgi:hypothetical protein